MGGCSIDAPLRAGRELVDRSESVQGGNRVVGFTYRLALENFAAAPAPVRLLERLPSGKEAEVIITLVSQGPELSGDSAYQQTDRKKGILRWDIEVPPQATATRAKIIEYKFKLEYDKVKTISGLPAMTP